MNYWRADDILDGDYFVWSAKHLAAPVHSRTPSAETGYPIRFPCASDIP
jgi:hypothetical protein